MQPATPHESLFPERYWRTGTVAALAVNGAAVDTLTMTPTGPAGDSHSTEYYDTTVPEDKFLPAKYDGQDRSQFGKHAEHLYPAWHSVPEWKCLNHRSWSAIAAEEVAAAYAALDVPPDLVGGLGENIIVKDIPKFTVLPQGTKLAFFRDGIQQCRLNLTMLNRPCRGAARLLERALGEETAPDQEPAIWPAFKEALTDRRGVLGNVVLPGEIKVGDEVRVYIPNIDPAWQWPD